MQLIRFTLFDHFDSYIVWIWFCSGLRFVSIINSVKICVDYCPVHGFCWFYHTPVCWLCGDQTWKSLGRYSWSMISFDYNWNNLHIVHLTEWYQSFVMTITSQWWLWPLFRSYLWTVWHSANKVYGRVLWISLCMFHLDNNRDSFSILAFD